MNLGSESETVEFKKSTGEHKEALQAISAMLNKHGGGELYFGVKDNGDVIGQEGTDATIRQVAGWGRTRRTAGTSSASGRPTRR